MYLVAETSIIVSKELASKVKTAGELLALVGRQIESPLQALLAEVHALDKKHEEDDRAAELVELSHVLEGVLEPLIALAAYERAAEPVLPEGVALTAMLENIAKRPRLASALRLSIRGELGKSFWDPNCLEQGLALFMQLVSGMSPRNTRLEVRREVHASTDHVVLEARMKDGAASSTDVQIALVRRLAELMRGELELEEENGELTLRLSLAVCQPPEVFEEEEEEEVSLASPAPVLTFPRPVEAVIEEAEPAQKEPGPLVLVADHEPAARDYMSRVLALEGYEVVTASTLEEAYESAQKNRPDVITLDHMQLRLDEVDWFQRFKNDPAVARIPIVLIRNPDFEESVGPLRASELVNKPLERDELVRAIERQTRARPSTDT
ncbi:MAG: response regulator [Acidobacteria bacterium]|nr:MAG: response regulator [Acidobacteriota bacterium]